MEKLAVLELQTANQPVPWMPTRLGCAVRSASSKYRVMLTVECAKGTGSTQVVSARARDWTETDRRKISAAQQVRPYIATIAPSPTIRKGRIGNATRKYYHLSGQFQPCPLYLQKRTLAAQIPIVR